MRALNVTDDELFQLLVLKLELLSKEEFEKAGAMSRRLKMPIERFLAERCRIPFGFLLEQLAQAWEVGYIDLKINDVKPEALRTIREQYARANALIPFDVTDKCLCVAMLDPRERRVIDEIRRLTGLQVKPFLAPFSAIQRAHLLYKGNLRELLQQSLQEDSPPAGAMRKGTDDDQTSTEMLNRVLQYAVVARASDIHIEPYEMESLVRCRIDGHLHEVLSLPPTAHPSFVARIKILSGMRIDEKRAPQDGRFEVNLGGLRVDLRVSSLPTLWGEKFVLRILPEGNVPLDLEDLGLSAADFQIVLRNILRPHGMVLVTGPTGSGKSTSLYAMILRLGAERHNMVNISTIEDPVEYTISRVCQVPLNPAAGIDFASGLRALLRQDPDVVMVGEIRDRETAEIAVRTALVGRLLLSTLHTNDSTGTVPRLLDIGVEPFLVASTLSLVIGQRLVRRICVRCRESSALDSSTLKALQSRPDFDNTIRILRQQGVLGGAEDPLSGIRLFRGRGCDQCDGAGFRGRIGIFELFEINDSIRRLIMQKKDGAAIRAAAIENGMKTAFQDGLGKAFLGETTLEEVFRAAL